MKCKWWQVSVKWQITCSLWILDICFLSVFDLRTPNKAGVEAFWWLVASVLNIKGKSIYIHPGVDCPINRKLTLPVVIQRVLLEISNLWQNWRMWDFCLDTHNFFTYFIEMHKGTSPALWVKISLQKLRSVIIASMIFIDYLINKFMFENIQCDNMNLSPPPSYFFYFDTYGRCCFVLTLRGDALFIKNHWTVIQF